jgi:phosphatidylglycerol:prolipoprotein diacylglycerol transferase
VFRACVVSAAVALASARLYVVVQDWEYFRGRLPEIVRIWNGGLGSYGAYAGATLALFVTARWQALPVGRLLDASALPIALMMAIGRVGCFLAGCCYGAPADVPWAVRFPAGSDPYLAHLASGLIAPGQLLSVPVHPVQLYEAVAALFLCWLLARHRTGRDGTSFALLFLLYPLLRYVTESWRGDPRGAVFALSAPQFFSLAGIGIAGWFLLRSRAGGAADGAGGRALETGATVKATASGT